MKLDERKKKKKISRKKKKGPRNAGIEWTNFERDVSLEE